MTTHRNFNRQLIVLATTWVVASVAFALPAHATTPSPPPTPSPSTPPDGGSNPKGQVQIEESWALTPVVPDDPNSAGNRSELSYVDNPGAVIEDAVTVFNLGNVWEDFHLYATDAFNNDTGDFSLLSGDEQPKDAGSWVTISQPNITVPPGMQVTVPITVKIPIDASAGDHAGAVVASSPTSSADPQGHVVTLDRRTGSRLYVRVNGPLTAELAVTNVDTSYDHAINPLGTAAHVTYTLENRGNVRLGGTVTVSVAGPFGIGERKITVDNTPELLPGEIVTLSANVDDVPQLMLGVTKVRVEPDQTADLSPLAADSTDRSFVPPLAVLLVVLAIVLGLLGWRAIRRHRAGDPSTVAQEPELSADPELEHQAR